VAGGDLARDKRMAADLDAWLCFEDESGQGLRPPKVRTWGRGGLTPVVKGTAQGSKRVSVAALVCVRPGSRARLIYRIHLGRGHGKHRRKGFDKTDYARLLDAAHQQLPGPIVLVWDNLPTHLSGKMRQLIAARSWLMVFQLPAYAPELNPVEGIWSSMKRCRIEFQSGVSEERIDQLGSILDPPEPVLHHRDQLVDTVHEEVPQAALDV
jgi:hypothetical protein